MQNTLTPQLRFERDNGGFTKMLDFPIDDNSQVIEIGGYIGEWTKKITDKFNPNLLIIEPVPQFMEILKENFGNNQKIKFENSAISSSNKKMKLYVQDSRTSETINIYNTPIEVDAYTIEYFFSKYNLEKVDLVQINIECEEYPLLNTWINSDILNKIKYLQIQFHTFCEDYQKRYDEIYNGLQQRGFVIKYRYEFVWEAWENKNL